MFAYLFLNMKKHIFFNKAKIQLSFKRKLHSAKIYRPRNLKIIMSFIFFNPVKLTFDATLMFL